MLTKIAVEDAVGTELAHDITEIRQGEFKGAAFKKGQAVCEGDICHLQKLGKNHLYLIDLEADPAEQHDVSGQHPEEVARLKKLFDRLTAEMPSAR